VKEREEEIHLLIVQDEELRVGREMFP